MINKSVQRRNQGKIILIALISIVPFVSAWFMAQHPEWLTRHSNYGQLVNPAIPVDYHEVLRQPLGNRELVKDLPGRWVLLSVTTDSCGEVCRQSLFKTHQLRMMLNKEISRVRRLLLAASEQNVQALNDWMPHDDLLSLAILPASFLQKIEQANGGPLHPGQLLLLDPEGNLMMIYAADFDPYGVLKDLKHLLRASQIG